MLSGRETIFTFTECFRSTGLSDSLQEATLGQSLLEDCGKQLGETYASKEPIIPHFSSFFLLLTLQIRKGIAGTEPGMTSVVHDC